MLYKFLNILFKFSQFIYFKNIEVEGVEKIPFNEANLLVANHPSAFMDPILIGANFSKPISFLAAEEFMGGEKTSVFLENQFNMIPIYRPSTRPDEIHKNNDSFDKCYQALNEKKSILIFAEGHSETQDWLDPLKTGSARIAIEVLAKFSDIKNVNIIPVGLNYSNPHQFRSTLYLKIGEIIKITRQDKYEKNNLTSIAYENLSKSINALEKEEVHWQTNLVQLVKMKLNLDLKKEHLSISMLIAELNKDKNNFLKLKDKIEILKQEFTKNDESITDFFEFKNSIKISYLTCGLLFLLFIPGFLANFIPVYFIKYFVGKKKFKYSFEGSMYFAFGTLFILIWHLIVVLALIYLLGWFSLLAPFGITITGLVSLKCRDYLLKLFRYKNLNKKFGNNNKLNHLYLDIEKLVGPILDRVK